MNVGPCQPEKTAHISRRHHWFPPARRRLRSDCRKCHYPDLGSDSDWSNREENFLQPIRSTTQICHQYGISAIVSQTFFQSQGNWWWRPECQEFAQVRAMYGIYLLSLKIFHLHFFAWRRNYFWFYVFFFGIGSKQLILEVCRIDRSWQCDALAWFTNSATITLRSWYTHAWGQVRKKKSLVFLRPVQFWEANQCISEQMVPLYLSLIHIWRCRRRG